MLYLRALDGSDPEPIKGTEWAMQPFFAPDGNWIGFWAKGKLRKVPRSGGIPKDLLVCPWLPYGAFWSESGRILWGERSVGLKWISAEGGDAEVLTRVNQEQETQHTLPFVLPGGKSVLFTVMPDDFGNRAHVEAASIPDGTRKMLIDDAADARYLPTGHILFLRQGLLMAAPFDPSRLELSGGSPDDRGCGTSAEYRRRRLHSGAGQFSVSASGSLVYASGGIRHFPESELVWVSRDGRVELLPGFDRLDVANQMRFSPDNRLLAFVQQCGPLWLFDLDRATFTRAVPRGHRGVSALEPRRASVNVLLVRRRLIEEMAGIGR